MSREVSEKSIWNFACFQYNACGMRKNSALSFRVASDLKAEVEGVAKKEGRSTAQVCEALIRGGLEHYRKEGPRYLQRLVSRTKGENQ